MPVQWLVLSIAMMLPGGAPALAAPQQGISSLAAIRKISNYQAQQHADVVFEATVTCYWVKQQLLFVQDGNAAIYVDATTDLHLIPGDRVLVRGKMWPSFRPNVVSSDIQLLGHGSVPDPIRVNFEQMIRADVDCRYIVVRGLVRAADKSVDQTTGMSMTTLSVLVDGEYIEGVSVNDNSSNLDGLMGAEVELRGVAGGVFDIKMQQVGARVYLQSLNDVRVLKRANVDPWLISETPIDRIAAGRRIRDDSDRLRVRGTVTYYEPGRSIVLQNGQKSIRVMLRSSPSVRIDDLAEATGFPDVLDGFLTLAHAEVRDTQMRIPVLPRLYRWNDLSVSGDDGVSHMFELVSIDGQVVTEVRQATQDEYVLQGDGHLFSAILRHPGSASRATLAPMTWIPVGSRIRVTGICMMTDADSFNGEVPFNILMRSIDDVQVLSRPPWLNVGHLLYLVAVLLIVITIVGARGWYIENRSRRRTAVLAHVEQRRARILEKMNHSRPLADILDEIASLISFRLRGLPCWCEVADGDAIGNPPANKRDPAWKIIEQSIQTNSAAPAGTFYVAKVGPNPSMSEVLEVLASSVGLASLAIENSRLHIDLVQRSEFDQLTNIRNRFSLERILDQQIGAARRLGTMLGLIYIDLNDFKLVNDRYGHLAGDNYLQEAASRMKHQLRPGDTIARLGGDEFAVLLPDMPSRTVAMEVAARLEHCFDTAFRLGGPLISGSASIGVAIFPEDASTKDGLLCAADAAMYNDKKARQRATEIGDRLRRSRA